MRRIESTSYHSGDLPTVTLYRQEVDEIVSLLASTAGDDGTVSIRSGRYAFESLDELCRERGKAIHQLELEANKGDWSQRVTLTIDDRHVSLTSVRAEPATYQRIRGVLNDHRRVLGFVPPGVSFLLSIFGGILFVVTAVAALTPGMNRARIYIALPLFLLLSCTVWILPTKSRVLLVRRHEHQTFWTRHAGDFIKGGIALGGTVLGYLIRVLQEYSKQP